MKILVVDDDPIIRDLIQFVLSEESGHEVITAMNGREALEAFQREPCRMVITDWSMPEMDGLELCRQIRETQCSGYVYIIILTSHRESQDLVEGLSAGADDYLPKPIDPQELLLRVRAAERVLGIETRDLLILALAKLAESRDDDTGRHLERVQMYGHLLARYLRDVAHHPEATPAFVQLVYDTSPLHDIGKVSVPDAILNKPGRLTETEFEVMKFHATTGANCLASILDRQPDAAFLRVARDIAACHHEKWNGTGYPLGLKGEEIPLAARIMALADVYDALTSRRVYKPALTHEQAKDIIVCDSGIHFDPDLVKAFLALEEAFLDVRTIFKDECAADGSPGTASTPGGDGKACQEKGAGHKGGSEVDQA